MTTVRYENMDGRATITLDRPETLNSMNHELMTDLRHALERVQEDESVRVVVLTGAGRGFCSGADLSTVGDGTDSALVAEVDAPAPDGGEGTDEDDAFLPAMRALATCPVPTIGRINGVAAGGGFGLAMACDISIAARSAFFVATFGPRLGIVPDLGTTWHLPLLVGPARARGISMLGGRIPAEQAAQWGLIWDVVDDSALDTTVDEVADQFKRSSPDAMTRIRSSIADAERNSLDQQLDLEFEHQRHLIPRNMVEGAAAFLERREPVFDSARQRT